MRIQIDLTVNGASHRFESKSLEASSDADAQQAAQSLVAFAIGLAPDVAKLWEAFNVIGPSDKNSCVMKL